MPFYRFGEPGSDFSAHLRIGGKKPDGCLMPRHAEDKALKVDMGRCIRMAVALCDAPGCDAPICELHRTKHMSKKNVDFCPKHSQLAEANA